MTWLKFRIYAIGIIIAIAMFQLLLVMLPLDVKTYRDLSIGVLIGGGLAMAWFPMLIGKKKK